jgi:hypothetical protein
MKKGFTLIEILIVVGVVMLIMVSISGIMSGIFNSQNKNKAIDKIDQNGSWILDELKKNILNANSGGENGGENFSCPLSIGTSILIRSVKDGNRTVISCVGNQTDGFKIASASIERNVTVDLFQDNQDLRLIDCNNFVTCSTLPSLQLSNVKFNFKLQAGVAGLSSGTTKTFSIDVTLRN